MCVCVWNVVVMVVFQYVTLTVCGCSQRLSLPHCSGLHSAPPSRPQWIGRRGWQYPERTQNCTVQQIYSIHTFWIALYSPAWSSESFVKIYLGLPVSHLKLYSILSPIAAGKMKREFKMSLVQTSVRDLGKASVPIKE